MWFFVFIFFSAQAWGSDWVRVKLWSEDLRAFSVEGSIHRLQGMESVLKTVALPQKQTLSLHYEKTGQQGRWVVEGFKNHPLIFNEKYLAIEGPDLRINHKKVPEKIILAFEKTSVQVIGVLPLEKYVMGVLAHEMPLQWPLETLKAQAIAARSYTVAVMNERLKKNYHLESSVMDQVYGFLGDEELSSKYDKVTEAVRLTKGQILMSTQKTVLKAYYHADCGGETASAKEAWTTKEELVSVTDASCPQNPKARWNLSLSDSEIYDRLKKWAPLGAQRVTEIKAIGVPGRMRVAQVEVAWDQGDSRKIEAAASREAMGFFDFKSTQFKVLTKNNQWLFEGRGFGHGVGLCQWGSRYLGRQGWDFEKILQHYYPKAEIKILEGTMVGLRNQTPL